MILSGIDNIYRYKKIYSNKRLALVTNNVASTIDGISSRVYLLQSGFNLVKIFSPEHGLNAKGIDGALQPDITDELTGLPVISLYGQHLAPTEYELKNVDTVLFDIPDVGCRFYTYLWTLTHVIEACARYAKPLVILDRPNPTGGRINQAEGPLLDEVNCSSFIGRWSIPVRHCCTLGELANYFCSTRIAGVDLSIIEISNWNRSKNLNEQGIKFIPTSPAITDLETAILYPGTGLLEGIDINEGRGTSTPFKVFGAPWINNKVLLEEWNRRLLPAIIAEAVSYVPNESLYKDEVCYGLHLHITDTKKFSPVITGVSIIQLLMKLFPDDVKERTYITVANPEGTNHFDKLFGLKYSFKKLFKNSVIPEINIAGMWEKQISPYLLY